MGFCYLCTEKQKVELGGGRMTQNSAKTCIHFLEMDDQSGITPWAGLPVLFFPFLSPYVLVVLCFCMSWGWAEVTEATSSIVSGCCGILPGSLSRGAVSIPQLPSSVENCGWMGAISPGRSPSPDASNQCVTNRKRKIPGPLPQERTCYGGQFLLHSCLQTETTI